MEKVEKIKINIARKINLGGYENLDFSLGVDIVGFDNESTKKVQKAIDFGRELCLKDVNEFYKRIKGDQGGIDKKYVELEKKINASENEQQLRTLGDKVLKIEDKKMQKIMQKKFNLKLISLKDE